jgi:hypothetical protein
MLAVIVVGLIGWQKKHKNKLEQDKTIIKRVSQIEQ